MQTTDFHCFNDNAEVHYAVIADHRIILLPRSAHAVALVTKFLWRWNVELIKHCTPLATPQMLCALSLAATGGNPGYFRADRGRTRALWKQLAADLFTGDTSDVYADHGLFGLPLPVARLLMKKQELTRAELLDPDLNFQLSVQWLLSFAAQFYVQHRQMPDALHLALHLHGSTFNYSADNPHRIQYRDGYLDRFITFFNSYTTPKELNETGRTV